jgi:hypothetical protein
VSFAVREGLVYALSQQLWPVRYRWAPVIRLLTIAVTVCVIGLLLPEQNIWISLTSRVLLLAGYVAGVWHARVLSADDRQAIRRFVRARITR